MATVADLPVKTLNGITYHYYDVQPHETLYSICKKLGVSRDEVLKYNPSVVDGLKAYQQLIFPASSAVENVTSTSNRPTYVVQKGETGYGISRKFGLSLEEFYKLNPSARDGVKEGATVYVGNVSTSSSASSSQSVQHVSSTTKSTALPATTGDATTTYVIGEHETLYQIARSHGISLSELLKMNPDLDVAYYQAGTTIIVPNNGEQQTSTGLRQSTAEAFSQVKDATTLNQYTVKAADTFYSIARAHGMSVEQLRSANPNVDVLQTGMVITLPQSCTEDGAETPTISPAANESITTGPSIRQDSPITIAVALPFMINQSSRGKQAEMYTEVYKGLLLAVDSMRHIGKPIRVLTFDTKGTVDGVKSILADSRLRSAQVIIAPDKADQLELFAKYGRDNQISVFNMFVVKDESYLTNPYVMNANIPHATMYDKAIRQFISTTDGCTTVFLTRTDGQQDKKSFVNDLKSALKAEGRNYLDIEFTGTLAQSNLSKLSENGRYVFVPISSKHSEVVKVLSALVTFKKSATNYDGVRLWGYPEWLTFRGDALSKMHTLDTYVFSRFFSVEDGDAETKIINANFARWYGRSMADVVPLQGLYGFDAGMFLIKALDVNGGDFSKYSPMYDGVQNCFNFVRAADGGGWINNEMYILNYAPGDVVNKISL